MASNGSSNGRWKIYFFAVIGFIVAMGLGAFLMWLVFYSGFIVKEEVILGDSPPIASRPLSLEERILEADVIARVKMRSVSASAEEFASAFVNDGRTDTFYVGALEYEFEVLEYLKGSGGGRLVAVVNGYDTLSEHKNKANAIKHGEAFLSARDTRWDDREAIVFLENNRLVITSTQQPGRYWLGGTGETRNGYTIDSLYAKKWLPAADVDGTTGQRAAADNVFSQTLHLAEVLNLALQALQRHPCH